MKADAQSSAEKEALEWAIDFFRNCKDDLKGDGSKRAGRELVLQMLIDSWDNSDAHATKLIEALQGSPRLPEFAAALIERGDPLPGPLRDFIAAFLREPNKHLKRHRGSKPIDKFWRDMNIAAAVTFIAGKWGISETRRRNQKSGRSCAASIVKDALATAASIHLSEDKVVKAHQRFISDFRESPGHSVIVGRGRLLIGKTPNEWRLVKLREPASD